MDAVHLIRTGGRLRVSVDPQAIERSFAELWDSARTAEDLAPATRAAAMNLVAVAPASDASEIEAVIADVTAALPSRVILLLVDAATGTSAMDAWLSALCRLGGSGAEQTCCELITLKASGEAVDELPTAVTPLLLGDLPSVLWLRTDPAPYSGLAERLGRFCTRRLVDLARFDGDAVSRLRRAAQLDGGRRRTADVLWSRLESWRLAIARFFDPVSALPMLEQIRSVRIAARGPVEETAAWEIALWMAHRLGWRLLRTEPREGVFRDAVGGEIAFALAADTPSAGEGDLLRECVVDTVDDDGHAILLRLRRSQRGARHLEATVESEGVCPRPWGIEIERLGEPDAVVRAIETADAGAGFPDAASVLLAAM